MRGVAVFSTRSTTSRPTSQLIRSRIIVAGAIALVLAALAGYLMARALTARIKRLEQAARKVAGGDFSNPIHADSDDELGQLATAFNDMQRQLAQLDTARKQFIASASHELRTPIFSLGGFLELLEDEELDEETRAPVPRPAARPGRADAQARDRAARPLAARGGRARAAARADRRRPARARDRGEFTPALRPRTTPSCRSARRPTRSRSTATLSASRRSCGSCSTTRSCTRRRARRSWFPPRATTGMSRLEVADTGLGIRHQTMPHIFEPFFTSADGAQGSGPRARDRARARRAHGRRLSVRSGPGETAFTLELPA